MWYENRVLIILVSTWMTAAVYGSHAILADLRAGRWWWAALGAATQLLLLALLASFSLLSLM